MVDVMPLPRSSGAGPSPAEEWRFSNGEVHFLWWFIQGSIMVPETRQRLRRAWGLCERHAWGSLAGEASFRHGYLHGPCKLYEDLMERARAAFDVRVPGKARVVAWRLRDKGPCLMCECGFTRDSRGIAPDWMVLRGCDPAAFRELAARTSQYWGPTCCGVCAGDGAPARCRPHFRADAARGDADLERQDRLVQDILRHLRVYSQSFVWGYHDIETDADRAALISAVGWCSGWRGLLALIDVPPGGWLVIRSPAAADGD